MIKIALFGLGHLGKIHLKCLLQLPQLFEVVGLYDLNTELAQQLAQQHGLQAWSDPLALMQAAQAVDIVTPTPSHYQLAKAALEQGKHLFIEKPLTQTVAQAEELLRLVQAKGLKAQVGHVERFNPALLAVQDMALAPKFIEAHRLSSFQPRGTEVSVVLDLMIHDLDILLSMVEAEVSSVQANGVAILSQQPDIANARIQFSNGAVANLTASRISLKPMRKFRLFQHNAYLSLDFLNKQTEVVELYSQHPGEVEHGQVMELDTAQGKRYLRLDMPEVASNNAIQLELSSFAQSILADQATKVGLEDGLRALALAHRIEHAMQTHLEQFVGEVNLGFKA
jgi:predicted dehydrogenase